MSTFSHAYGATAMFESVARAIKDIEEPDIGDIDIHTVTLELNGQHGEFDLTIKGTDNVEGFLEDCEWRGIAHRNGGVTDLKEVDR